MLSDQSKERIFCFLVDYGAHSACNLACRYCRKRASRKSDIGSITASLTAVDVIARHVDAVMFKASGWGEITIVPEYPKLFERASARGYGVLQLITNGVEFPDHDIRAALCDLGHFSLQISLDGNSGPANAHRFRNNETMLARVKDHIASAAHQRIPLEVNTVLTSANIGEFEAHLEFLADLADHNQCRILCLPRPLQIDRAQRDRVFLPDFRRLDDFEALVLGRFDAFRTVLPPQRYLEGLLHYLRTRQRVWTAYDSTLRVLIGEHGVMVLPCQGEYLDSVFSDDPVAAFVARATRHRTGGDIDFGPKLTQFEVHSLFIGGEIGWDEMATIPSCDNPVARERLEALRRLASAESVAGSESADA